MHVLELQFPTATLPWLASHRSPLRQHEKRTTRPAVINPVFRTFLRRLLALLDKAENLQRDHVHTETFRINPPMKRKPVSAPTAFDSVAGAKLPARRLPRCGSNRQLFDGQVLADSVFKPTTNSLKLSSAKNLPRNFFVHFSKPDFCRRPSWILLWRPPVQKPCSRYERILRVPNRRHFQDHWPGIAKPFSHHALGGQRRVGSGQFFFFQYRNKKGLR